MSPASLIGGAEGAAGKDDKVWPIYAVDLGERDFLVYRVESDCPRLRNRADKWGVFRAPEVPAPRRQQSSLGASRSAAADLRERSSTGDVVGVASPSFSPMNIRMLLVAWAVVAGATGAVALAQPSPDAIPHLGPLEEPAFPPPPPDYATIDGALAEPADSTGVVAAAGVSNWSDGSYIWQVMPQGLIYRSYLAGAKESRFRSVWNDERNQGDIWDITLGGNVGLLRYGTRGNVRPEGWQLGIEGAGLVRLDIDENRDVDAADYRFGVPMTWGDSIYQVKFAYYHLSSHVGDEFLLKHPGFNRLNYSRDVLVLGNSLYPTDNWRVYGEMGYAVDCDVCDPWEFQFGLDWSPLGRTGGSGAPFAAVNGHLREEVDFGGNFVAQTGWCWRRSPASGLYRLGVEYYNGKDDQFSFFDQSVQKVGAAMWYDY